MSPQCVFVKANGEDGVLCCQGDYGHTGAHRDPYGSERGDWYEDPEAEAAHEVAALQDEIGLQRRRADNAERAGLDWMARYAALRARLGEARALIETVPNDNTPILDMDKWWKKRAAFLAQEDTPQ